MAYDMPEVPDASLLKFLTVLLCFAFLVCSSQPALQLHILSWLYALSQLSLNLKVQPGNFFFATWSMINFLYLNNSLK